MKQAISERLQERDQQTLSLRLTARIFETLGPYRWLILAAAGMAAVSAWADMQIILFASRIFETEQWRESGILRPLLPIILLCILNRVFGWSQWILAVYSGNRAIASLRKRFFARLMQFSKSFFDLHKSGWLVARSTGDMGILQDFTTYALMMLGTFSTIIISAWFRISQISPVLLIPAAAIMPAIVIMTAFYRRKMSALQRHARDQNSRLVANMAETVRGVRVVHAFSRQERNLEDFNTINLSSHDTEIRIARLDGAFMPALDFITVLNLIIVVLFATWIMHDPRMESVARQINTGDIIAYVLYMNVLIWPTRMIVELYSMSLRAMSAAERIFEVIDLEPDIIDPPEPVALASVRGALSFRNVSFRYGDDDPWIIRNLNLDIRPGETLALAGATGAGKTTLLSLIARFYDPQEGAVLLDGVDLTHISQDDLHQHMGIVLQQGYLFSGSVMENLKFRRTDIRDEDVIAQAKRLGTHASILALRDGYQTQILEGGESLSLGQRQILAITRALLAAPSVLLLDEPTSSLDVYTESVIQGAMQKVVRNCTAVMIAHRLSTIEHADRILVIDKGRVAEEGTHTELLRQNGIYSRLVRHNTLEPDAPPAD